MINLDIQLATIQREWARQDREDQKRFEAEQQRFEDWVKEQELLSEIDPDREWPEYQ